MREPEPRNARKCSNSPFESLLAAPHSQSGRSRLCRCRLGSGYDSVQNLSHIWSGDGFGLRDLRLIERPHVHVALGSLEQLLGIPRKFENLYALVHVRLFGRLVPRDFAQAVVLLLAPLS
jgi:hypothetical protein